MAKKTRVDEPPRRIRLAGAAPTWDELDDRLRAEVGALLSAEAPMTVESLMKIARLASTWRIYTLSVNEDRRAEEIHLAKLAKLGAGSDGDEPAGIGVPDNVKERIKMLYGLSDDAAGG